MKNQQKKMLAYVLLGCGVVLLIFGVHQFVEFQQSVAGRAASFGNQLSRSLGGSTRVADGYIQPILLIIGGIVAGAAGFFMLKRR